MSTADGNSYQGLLDSAALLLNESSDTPRIDAEVLMQHVTGKPLAWLIAHHDAIALPNHCRDFFAAIAKRQDGTPVAYIVGSREFWTLQLKVNQHVLIPRPDTETLVEQALDVLSSERAINVLDLGTGSGAIALALAKERPLANVVAVDCEAGALSLAQENAKLNELDNVAFVQSRWFAGLPANAKFDLIASNPPYVRGDDPHLKQGDLRFEPDVALIADDGGLADLREIVSEAPQYLAKRGHLIVEHGFDQADAVKALFQQAGFQQIELFKDLNHLPRCTRGTLLA